MGFTFSTSNIRENQVVFIYEECAYPGVRQIAGRIREDIEKIFDAKPMGVMYENFADTAAFYSFPIFFGTVGKSEVLDKLAATTSLNLFGIAGESEKFSVTVMDDVRFEGFSFESAIVVAGSDITGTIYGLFKLSEMLGVSPLTDWLDVMPKKAGSITLSEEDSFVSKTPSVRYRGFSVSKDDPAFLAYINRHYGNMNVKAYRQLFELLLRLKGNHMCTNSLSGEEPDEESRALAEEMGITLETKKVISVSSVWFNTTHLPNVWEQMSASYDNGNKDRWIADAGAVFTNEYPLSYFLDLAYDFDKWGTSNINSAQEYTRYFVDINFPTVPSDTREDIKELLLGYTKMNVRRRTEAMTDTVYAPLAFGESERMLRFTEDLMNVAKRIYDEMGDTSAFAFYELVYLPLTATMNVQKMWLLTCQNHAYAAMGSTYANTLADDIQDCIKKDRKLIDKLQSIRKEKWYGMGISAHSGLTLRGDGQSNYPVIHTVIPVSEPRILVRIPGYETGTNETIMAAALEPSVTGGFIELSTASEGKVSYTIESDDDFISIPDPGKNVKCGQIKKVFILVDREKIPADKEYVTGKVRVISGEDTYEITVPVYDPKDVGAYEENTYLFCGAGSFGLPEYVSMEAGHFTKKIDTAAGSFKAVNGYGRCSSAVKAFPTNVSFERQSAPVLVYSVVCRDAGSYNVRLYTGAADPEYSADAIVFAMAAGPGELTEVNMPAGNICFKDVTVEFKRGLNELKIAALSPGFILEKIVITPDKEELPYSYLGPAESFHY